MSLLSGATTRRRTTTLRVCGAVLGAALAGLATALDVDGVVVGGGVAGIGAAFLEPAREAFFEHVLEPLRGIEFRAGALGSDAPLIGAAGLNYAADLEMR